LHCRSCATNAISYTTDLLGEVTLIGPGAGGVATGFAVVSDGWRAALAWCRGASTTYAIVTAVIYQVLLSGNLPNRTEVASVRVYSAIEGGNQQSAAAVATILLVIALAAIVIFDVIQRRLARRG